MTTCQLALVGIVLLTGICQADLPKEYADGAKVELMVNQLTSAKTQLPFDFSYLPVCSESPLTSRYELFFNRTESCKLLCPTRKLLQEDKDKFRSMIDDDYSIDWMVDGLPGGPKMQIGDGTVIFDHTPLGWYDFQQRYYLFNHMELVLEYHNDPSQYQGNRIVGLVIVPRSIKHNDVHGCAEYLPALDLQETDNLSFTYDVVWQFSPVRWIHRWDVYSVNARLSGVHWFAMINSLLIASFMAAALAVSLRRSFRTDVERAEDTPEWKLVHGDVFRKPPCFVLLAVSVGTGVQLLCVSVVTIGLSFLGLWSHGHQSNMLLTMLCLFAVMGILAGYVEGRFTKLIDESASCMVGCLAGTLYPFAFFTIFILINVLVSGEGSSAAVDVQTLCFLLVLCCIIPVPLVLLGFKIGFRMDAIEVPVQSSVPRAIPEQSLPRKLASLISPLAGGILVFSSIYTELFFLESATWQLHSDVLFGYLAVTIILLTVFCAEVSIALTYFQLASGDYRWWWSSFCASGSSGLYMFIYAIIYFGTRLEITRLVSTILYFGYMAMASMMLGLLTGSIGFLFAFVFVRAIYGSVKGEITQ